MARNPRLDPAGPSEPITVKVGPAVAGRVTELASSLGLSRSAFVRQAVLDAIGRAGGHGPEPPDDGG